MYACLVRLFVILWTVAHQAPLSVGFSKHKYRWLPPSRDLPNPDQTQVSYISCIVRQLLYHWHHLGSRYSGHQFLPLLYAALLSVFTIQPVASQLSIPRIWAQI